MQFIDEIPVWGSTKTTRWSRRRSAPPRGLLCLDGRRPLGYGVPIGDVIASEGRISPTAVGFDIACGNKAVRLDIPAAEVRQNIHTIMDDIWRTLSFGVGRKNRERNDDSPFLTKSSKDGTRKRHVR